MLWQREGSNFHGKRKDHRKAVGIDLSGGLRIKLRNGRLRIVHAGEVTLRR